MGDDQIFFRAWFEVQPELGDIIEILHFGYSHFAIWVGGGWIIHVKKDDGWWKIVVRMFLQVTVVKCWVLWDKCFY